MGVLVVVTPEGANLVLATDVPDREADAFVLHCLNIETYIMKKGLEGLLFTDSGDGGHYFTEFELEEDSGLAGGIQANHQNAHLFLSEEGTEDSCQGDSHGGASRWDEVRECEF